LLLLVGLIARRILLHRGFSNWWKLIAHISCCFLRLAPTEEHQDEEKREDNNDSDDDSDNATTGDLGCLATLDVATPAGLEKRTGVDATKDCECREGKSRHNGWLGLCEMKVEILKNSKKMYRRRNKHSDD
jgi:hypothetical protein